MVIIPYSGDGFYKCPFMAITEPGSKTGTPVNPLSFSHSCLNHAAATHANQGQLMRLVQ